MSLVRLPAGMSIQRARQLLSPHPDFRPAVLAASPTNYWPANEGTGTPVDIVGGHTTSMVGSMSWMPASDRSKGAALDWTDTTTNYPSFAELENTGDFTWQVAAQFDSLANVFVLCSAPSDRGYWGFDNGALGRIQLDGSFAVSPVLTAGRWYLLHLARSGSTATMYVDGVSAGSRASTQPFRVNNFGRYNTAGFSMDGRMNHFARWSGTALSAARIADLAARWAA